MKNNKSCKNHKITKKYKSNSIDNTKKLWILAIVMTSLILLTLAMQAGYFDSILFFESENKVGMASQKLLSGMTDQIIVCNFYDNIYSNDGNAFHKCSVKGTSYGCSVKDSDDIDWCSFIFSGKEQSQYYVIDEICTTSFGFRSSSNRKEMSFYCNR